MMNKIFIIEIFNLGELDAIIDSLTEDDLFILVSLSGEFSTVNLYILPASFAVANDTGNTQFLNLMPFFLLVEFFYLNCRIYIEQQE